MSLKDAHVLKCDSMHFVCGLDKKNRERLEIKYYDVDGEHLTEYYYLNSKSSKKVFFHNFVRKHIKQPGKEKLLPILDAEEMVHLVGVFRKPMFVIARRVHNYWTIREKVF